MPEVGRRLVQIGEDKVEGSRLPRRGPEGVAGEYLEVLFLRARTLAGGREVSAEASHGSRIQLHECAPCGSSTEGFQSMRARACEKVEKGSTLHELAKTGKETFASRFQNWAQFPCLGYVQDDAFRLAAGNSHEEARFFERPEMGVSLT